MTEEISKTFNLATSYTIGSYILPGENINNIQKIVNQKIKLSIIPCDEILAEVKAGNFDIGLIESPLTDDDLVLKEWMSDELVICSNQELPQNFDKEKIASSKLICRPEDSLTRNFITGFLEQFNLSYHNFKSLIKMENATVMIQSVKWSRPNVENPTVTIVSKLAIESELKYQELYQSRINNTPMRRKFHLVYDKNSVNIEYIDEIIKFLQESQKKR